MIGTAVVMETHDHILYPSISICSLKYSDEGLYSYYEGQEPSIFAQKSPNVKDAIVQLRYSDINGTERIMEIGNNQNREDIASILPYCNPNLLCVCHITAR